MGRPGAPGPTGPSGEGIQGPKVKFTVLQPKSWLRSTYQVVFTFLSVAPLIVKQCDVQTNELAAGQLVNNNL